MGSNQRSSNDILLPFLKPSSNASIPHTLVVLVLLNVGSKNTPRREATHSTPMPHNSLSRPGKQLSHSTLGQNIAVFISMPNVSISPGTATNLRIWVNSRRSSLKFYEYDFQRPNLTVRHSRIYSLQTFATISYRKRSGSDIPADVRIYIRPSVFWSCLLHRFLDRVGRQWSLPQKPRSRQSGEGPTTLVCSWLLRWWKFAALQAQWRLNV